MIYELLALSEVLATVRETGTEVRYYDPKCSQDVAGFYRFGPNVDRLVICPDNQLNHSDLFDTIRHEAIHVVQACNGWEPVFTTDTIASKVTPEIRDSLSAYPQDRQTQELETEAYVLSEHLSEDLVVSLLEKYCFR